MRRHGKNGLYKLLLGQMDFFGGKLHGLSLQEHVLQAEDEDAHVRAWSGYLALAFLCHAAYDCPKKNPAARSCTKHASCSGPPV